MAGLSEDSTDIFLTQILMLTDWDVDFAKETGKSFEEVEKRERITVSDHGRCFKSIASGMFGESGEIVVDGVLVYDFPGRLALLFDGNGSESGGRNVLDQVQADSRTVVRDAESLGPRLAQVTPSTEIRERANSVCAQDARRCWFVFAVESGGTVSRVTERNCGGTAGRKESVRPRGPSSGLQGSEVARCESVLDGIDCCNLEWKLYESALGDGFVEQSSDEQRTASRSAGVSSHLHNDHGPGTARLDKELDNPGTGLEA